ncbi:MAG: sulfurtransferase TusA family protein [Pseudomonadota bacterium]|nr:sulfurtransferase TusA family protein [Pseudomonadota bacterium]
MSITTLDARRLLCPLPVIRTQDAVADLNPGDSLQILCTDPGVIHDIPAWCRLHGHQVCAINEQDHEIAITIRVGSCSI